MNDDDTPRPVRTQVHLARAVAENLRPRDLAEELADRSPGLLLIDVREPDEAASGGVIEGAIVVPRGTIEFAVGVASDRRVVVYCSTGERSALVVHTLYGLGHCDIAHLDGGIVAWERDGFPLVEWSSPAPAAQRQAAGDG